MEFLVRVLSDMWGRISIQVISCVIHVVFRLKINDVFPLCRSRGCPARTNCSEAYAGYWDYDNCATENCGEGCVTVYRNVF